MKRFSIRELAGLALLLTSACGGDGGPTGTPVPATGTISGTVTAAGAGVPGATITLSAGGTQTTSGSGQFTFSDVAVGSHTLTLTVPADHELDTGETEAKTITVTAGQTAQVSWTLRLAAGPPPQQATVQMNPASFDPSAVTIARGGTVRWVNAAPVAHTITPENSSQAGVWASQNVPATQGFTFQHVFDTAGTFPYTCSIHAGMTGTVQVQ